MIQNYHTIHMKITTIVKMSALAAVFLPALASADENDPQKAVIFAARSGEPQLQQLIHSGISVDATNEDGETALMQAADKGDITTVQRLLKNGAQVNKQDEDGKTALMFAAHEGHTAVVNALISAGADINARDKDGDTALMMAEDEDHEDTVTALRAAGAVK